MQLAIDSLVFGSRVAAALFKRGRRWPAMAGDGERGKGEDEGGRWLGNDPFVGHQRYGGRWTCMCGGEWYGLGRQQGIGVEG